MQLLSLAACLTATFISMPPGDPPESKVVDTISPGAAFSLEKSLYAEHPTVVLFYQQTSSADRAMAQQMAVEIPRDLKGRLGLRLIVLKSLDDPAAKQYEIKETPTLMILDRFGNLLKRTSKFEEIMPSVGKSLTMARIKWVDEGDPAAATTYKSMGGGKSKVAGIMKTMSLRPELMEGMNRIAGMAHFTDGYLPRRTKEMIATYVSAINHCKF